MTNPNTRLDEGETEFERELLRTWTNENPSSRARANAIGLVAAGAALGATSATNAAGAALGTVAQTTTPKVATIGALAVVKWLAAGAILAVGTASVVAPFVLSRPTTRSAASAAPSSRMAVLKWTVPTERVVPDPVRPQEAPSSVSDRVVSPAARPAVSAASATAHFGSPSTSTSGTAGRVAPLLPDAIPAPSGHGPLALGDQVISLDEARDALAGGNAADATRLLDEYEARFPNGSLRQEATVLRVEALVKQGDRQRATTLGAQFLSAHPSSPHATKIRELLSGDESP